MLMSFDFLSFPSVLYCCYEQMRRLDLPTTRKVTNSPILMEKMAALSGARFGGSVSHYNWQVGSNSGEQQFSLLSVIGNLFQV